MVASLSSHRICSVQAHHNAQRHSDEFVKSALVSLDKLPVLVQELLTFEVSPLTFRPLELVDAVLHFVLCI